jgi:DNA polymerase V
MDVNKIKIDSFNSLQLTELFGVMIGQEQTLPIFSTSIAAGFPSPADDYIEQQLDLNQLIIKHPTATFFVRVQGESMRDAGIQSGDILVVDRSAAPAHGKIVVAVIDGEFTVKRIHIEGSEVFLVPENPAFSRFKVSPESQFQVWGVVTYVIHKAQ